MKIEDLKDDSLLIINTSIIKNIYNELSKDVINIDNTINDYEKALEQLSRKKISDIAAIKTIDSIISNCVTAGIEDIKKKLNDNNDNNKNDDNEVINEELMVVKSKENN